MPWVFRTCLSAICACHPIPIAKPLIYSATRCWSPAAWRHIHLNGHYRFRGGGQIIDLDAIIAGLEMG